MPRSRSGGAALITALLIAALAAVMVSGMLWHQWGAISREQTAKEATQARWILRGAVDWARLILREDARNSSVDDLSEPWAVPLAESRLSTFLAARGQSAGSLPDAWLEGHITDAQSRFNLANLAPAGRPDPAAAAIFGRLCATLGVGDGPLNAIASGIASSASSSQSVSLTTIPAAASLPSAQTDASGSTLPLRDLQDLARLSPEVAAALPQLAPYVTLLPQPTPVNANTASATVLAAVLDLSADAAARLVQVRTRAYFRSTADITTALGQQQAPTIPPLQVGVSSGFFDATAAVRIGQFAYAERALIQRVGLLTQVLRMQRVPPWLAQSPAATP
ncbi:MAG: type II secretion system minor pseudopilin GspK [Proteobacteria bacterium]|nr:type II secretion system minor pseudopilin GspK [Pseudomonadota bacterium]